MGFVLSVYSKNAFKEFVLPAVNNTEITLPLEHYIFQNRDDIGLKMEVIDGNWYFRNGEDSIYTNGKEYAGKPLTSRFQDY